MLRVAMPEDAPALCAIYNPYVLGTTITFEEVALSPAEMAQRIAEVRSALPWLVCEEEGAIVGYAYASKWKGRCAYRYSAETTVYVREDMRRRGIGSKVW